MVSPTALDIHEAAMYLLMHYRCECWLGPGSSFFTCLPLLAHLEVRVVRRLGRDHFSFSSGCGSVLSQPVLWSIGLEVLASRVDRSWGWLIHQAPNPQTTPNTASVY